MRILTSLIFSLFLLSASFYFSGCEGDFRAKRNFNSENLAGPYQMRMVTIDATNYLAVSNSNVNFSYSNGSLQFFSLASPAAPVRVAAMDLALPTNISDFWIYTDAGTDEWLFILDRNQAQVLVYKYDGTKFTPRLDASGEATAISVAPNPQSLLMFTSATLLGKKVLAVNCQSSQTIQFILPDTFERYEPTPTLSSDLLSYNGKWGSAFYMRPRQTVGGEDDRIQLTYDEARGFGINDLFFMGDDDETLVTASFITSGIFSYQFKNFANVSNLVWDYINFRNGRVVNNVFYPGTGEYGFRGLAGDQDNNIFLSSRGDNQVYKIPAGTLATSKATDLRNTTGYPFDDRRHMLTTTPDFDSDPTDVNFPRLSELVTDCPKEILPSTAFSCAGGKTAADRVWVLGIGSNKVYRLALSGTNATMTSTGSDVALNAPQKLIWYPVDGTAANDLLYIANTIGNTIEVVRAETLAHVTTINTVNP